MEIKERIGKAVSPVLEEKGIELVEFDYKRRGRDWVLRLFITKPQGVTVEDCKEVSEQLEGRLEFLQPCSLEVSSPGLDRVLKGEREYEIFAGRLAKVTTKNGFHRGRLRGIKGRSVVVEKEGGLLEIPLDEIITTRLEPEI